MESEFVCSVQKENKLGFYRIHSTWSNEGVRINIASKDASWFGQVSHQKIEETSKSLNMAPDVYLEECKAALTTDEGMPGLVYAVEDGSFVWKKTIDEELGIKIQLGSIPLEPVSFVDTIQKMLDVALSSKQKLQNNLLQSSLDKNESENKLNQTFQKLNECNNKIKNMENDLMRNFVLVLNAKKSRISELEQEVTMLRSSRPKKVRKKEPKTEDLNPYDVDTDEDMPVASAVEASVSGLTVHNSIDLTNPRERDMHQLNDEGNSLAHSSELTKETCELNEGKPADALPSKSSDILDFFFGALS